MCPEPLRAKLLFFHGTILRGGSEGMPIASGAIAKSLDPNRFLTPVFGHFYKRFQEYFFVEKLLQRFSGVGSRFFQRLSAFAVEYFFLRLAPHKTIGSP